MNRPQPPGNLLLLVGGVSALAATVLYITTPPSKVTGMVGQEDSSTAAGHRKEGVKREDANPQAQKADVRQKAL
ncbi:hypothetical protein GY45DRAFT_1373081 [Cubamyces sp. BRFM 1775]|nr:hypothetical protein GY45DRAFT_1373081 [Cubamyces sp. BRFM 1775]